MIGLTRKLSLLKFLFCQKRGRSFSLAGHMLGMEMTTPNNDMLTKVVRVEDNMDGDALQKILQPAIADLRASRPVAIPTETVYGLAANALSSSACRSIYQTKNRPADNPLIVHISSLDMLRQVVREKNEITSGNDILDTLDIPPVLKPVLRTFWPGPLTVLLPKKENIPDIVTAGLPTVAVRYPRHPIAQKIIELCGFPLAAPSANLSGRPSPTSAEHVLEDLRDRVGVIVDAGPSAFGLESTVLDATRSPALILRPGSITASMLKPLLPDIQVFSKSSFSAATKAECILSEEEIRQMEERPATPGMKYRHYSPTSPLLLFHVDYAKSISDAELTINTFISEELKIGKRIAHLPLRPCTLHSHHPNYHQFPLSLEGCLHEVARNLFAALRSADLTKPDLIVAQSVIEEDEGLAIMNRLSKAASLHRNL